MNQTDTDQSNQLNESGEEQESALRSWIIVMAISFFFLLWGLVIYFSVGVSWPPPWRYGIVPDVPGQSVYSVQEAEKRAGRSTVDDGKIREEHVMGQPGKAGTPQAGKDAKHAWEK
jgi:hypothetical protein